MPHKYAYMARFLVIFCQYRLKGDLMRYPGKVGSWQGGRHQNAVASILAMGIGTPIIHSRRKTNKGVHQTINWQEYLETI